MKNLNKSIILGVLLALPIFAFAQISYIHQGSIPGNTTVISPEPSPIVGPSTANTKFNLKIGGKQFFSRYLGLTIILNSLDENTVNVSVSTIGGCGPNADPRCLGAPGFEGTFDLKLGEPKRIPGTGASLTFAQKISDDEAMFILVTLEAKSTLPVPSPIPTPPRPTPSPTYTPTPTHTPTHTPTPHMSTISNIKLDFVTEVREVESGSYEIKGKQKGRFLFLFPIEIDVSYSLTDNAVTNVKRPWWSILVW